MKTPNYVVRSMAFCIFCALIAINPANGAPATVLFEEDFNYGFPGWTVIQPSGSFSDGPPLWHYDVVRKGFVEASNYFTDGVAGSPTRRATMLINDTVTPEAFTYTARLVAGDDDGFGLIFGYRDVGTFYRVQFAWQNVSPRAQWPYTGWSVDRMVNGEPVDLFGAGMPGYQQTFVSTQNRPFDVTIVVANNRLTLTVVDDPNGSATVHNLVVEGDLQGDTDGKVGIFSWGMGGAGGSAVRSFLVQNPILAPTPLAGGDFSAILNEWTGLITPRTDGSTVLDQNGPSLWSIGINTSGPRNRLMENSDHFHNGDNNAGGSVHFAAPSLVAGDSAWTDYVYSARFISADDDGFGMLLRFANETNFYRIALRLQNSTSGAKQGLSVQKAVDRVFSEIAWDRNTFQPPMNVPIDMHAAIKGNQLRIIIVSNPTGAAQTFTFGPYDIAGSTVDAGKVGVFSWAQMAGAGAPGRFGTEVDYVRVASLSGEALVVSSQFGEPEPAVGTHDYSAGTSVTASVASPVNDAPGVRRVVTGWSGQGSVPASGADSSVTFDINSFSALNWNWKTEYQLTVSAAGGQVNTPGEWLDSGTAVSLTAQADAGYVFVGWSGDIVSANPTINFNMTGPRALTAEFAVDLRIINASISGGNLVLSLAPLPQGAAYHVQRATAIDGEWVTVANDQTSSEYTEPLGDENAFYRLVLAQ